ncbi:UPF0554 protein C2orf43 homolog [Fopius arisanus]|uniref:Lipid droplet-associated hydrolase n=1 Tax=Fopius arisanus TaxID=64838 RepID=A0A0C9RLH7_9HYME|nr:PREDICTED: UPF0554 protein C2orf43 homolog [Fopius arisanus]XP_011310741.1 PREDICTED: UPF0554 protein C2orf43 homolog [Fopius arisanus]
MQQAMLRCNGIPTHIITEGRWVEEGLLPDGHRDIILVIPGNPGIPAFYTGFIKALKSCLPTETPVWVMGHAGHVLPPKTLSFPSEQDSMDRAFSLQGQVEHKVAFVKEYIPKDARVHLVGHSIGAWFILQLLGDEEFVKKVVKCYLLFPTIENMAETKSGIFFSNILLRIAPLLYFLAWIFTFFPKILREFLVRVFGILFVGFGSQSVQPMLQLIEPEVLKRVFLMGKEEMHQVRELDHRIISKYSDKLWLYYGATDGWVPVRYYDRLKARHPEVEAHLCKRGFRHAFVLSNEKDVGKMVGDLINESIN